MSKFRIRSKHKRIFKKIIVSIIFLLLFVLVGLMVSHYKQDLENKEKALLISEKESYVSRKEVVEELNQIYDYSANGYMKLNREDRVNVLVISDSDISSYDRYKIMPVWQNDLNSIFDQLNGQENLFNNILLRGSNTMWAYMQVSSDLSRKDYDFAIIEMNNNDIRQLSEDEYKLYYEGVLRQLYKQFVDIEVFVVFSNDLMVDLSKDEKELLMARKTWTKKFNERYAIETIEVEDKEYINEAIVSRIEHNRSKQDLSDTSIIVNPFKDSDTSLEGMLAVKNLHGSLNLKEAQGFFLNDGLIVNEASENYLLYEVKEEFAFINYVRFKDGSKFEIYINDVLFTVIDSYSEITGVGVLALPGDKSQRNIKIIALNKEGLQRYMMMDNLLVGESE